MIFEKIQTVPTADELVDKAFSRSVRAGRGKMGGPYNDKREVEESMVITAGNIFSHSSFPKSPPSLACGFNAATPMRGLSRPQYRMA